MQHSINYYIRLSKDEVMHRENCPISIFSNLIKWEYTYLTNL